MEANLKSLKEGEVVTGKVLKILDKEVIVDIGYKSEGVIDVEEFRQVDGSLGVAVGDRVDVLLEKSENADGYVVLSKDKAEKMRIWDEVEKAYETGEPILGRVVDRIKGGLKVDIGLPAFLPGSLVDIRPVRNLDVLRGQSFRMRVIKVNKRRGNIVLSRKAVLDEENAEKKKKTLEDLEEGKIIRGVVKNLTEYGAFVDLGGIDGLLHITDMAWAGSTIRRRSSRSATSWTWWSSSSTGSGSGSPSASSSCRSTRGRRRPRSTRPRPASAARS